MHVALLYVPEQALEAGVQDTVTMLLALGFVKVTFVGANVYGVIDGDRPSVVASMSLPVDD
jgi:hypothetical protein